MRAEAFTYSHFGLNQFALQNAQTVCEALKVKHHVVSLGNDAHLTSFKRYFRTWFHDPSTTSAGLTCVLHANICTSWETSWPGNEEYQ